MADRCKAFVYLRVSTESQALDGVGLDVQKELCGDFCRDQKLDIVDDFTDPGISGTTVDRPGLQEMLSRIEEVDFVVVSSTSRLWRDIYPQALIHKALRDKGKDVKAVDEPSFTIYTDNDPNQFLVSSILGVLDVWEKLSIVQRLGRGRQQKAKMGFKASGSAAFGYRWGDGGKGRAIEPVESEAQVVREMFLLLLRYGSVGRVRREITRQGYLNRRGNPFSWQATRNILGNDF